MRLVELLEVNDMVSLSRDLVITEETDDIAKSLWSLAKYNDGKFKSEKQGKFLLSKCLDGEYVSSGRIYNSSYTFVFDLDKDGIVQISKSTGNRKLDKHTIVWERPVTGKVSAQQAAADKQADKHAKQLKKEKSYRISSIPDTIKAYYDDMAKSDDPKRVMYALNRIVELKREYEHETGENQDVTDDIKKHNAIVHELIRGKLANIKPDEEYINMFKQQGLSDDEIAEYMQMIHSSNNKKSQEADELKSRLL